MDPPRFRCPNCDTDLSDQHRSEAGPVFLPEDEIQGCYDRAAELALTGNYGDALGAIERGLERVNASELHLLAAIIHRKQHAYDQMRRHVAAIPVDDVLRAEAEWLLRSHQEQQRALRQAAQTATPPRRATPLDPSARPLNRADRFLLNEFGEEPPRRRFGWAWALPVVAVFAVLIWWQAPLINRYLPLDNLLGQTLNLPAAERSDLTDSGGQSPTEDTVTAPTPLVTPTPQATALPTATPLPNVVEAVPTETPSPEPIAAGDESSVVQAVATAPPFNLAAYLRLRDRPDLADLDIDARLQDRTLLLQGVVTSTRVRNELLSLATELPNVEDVNAIDLLLRLPETYTVQENDTLWNIAFDFYGDAARWRQILDMNTEILGEDGTLLSPGQVLTLPPF
ncbi:MAG: LysM peptidoglycan-binding domain-containing protein [Caldilineaceae bacterium]